MDKSCSLCRESLSSDHRRKKKLHGPGCAISKMVLLELMSTINGVFPTLQDSDALLCHICELSLNNIKKLEKKIDDLKTKVRDQLSALCQITAQKRLFGADSNPLLPKQLEMLPSSIAESEGASEVVDSGAAGSSLQDMELDDEVKQSPTIEVSIY